MTIPKISILALLLASACAKGAAEEVNCAALADKVIEVSKTELGKLDEAQQRASEAQFPALRSSFVAECKKHPARFTQAVQKCMLAAASSADLDACENAGQGEK